MRKPVIGVTPLYNEETNDFWMLKDYLDCIIEAGGVPVVLPFADDIGSVRGLSEALDGFLFTGGPDVDPILYDVTRFGIIDKPLNLRDKCEKALFDEVIRTDKPILGICRGLQFMNVMCGGTLYQDIIEENAAIVNHRMAKPYNREQHTVYIYPDTPLARIIKETVIGVNSCHHQAICELAPCLDAMALSIDGYIESFFMPGKRFVQGYQWHPEMYPESPFSKAIFGEFIKSCIENIETVGKIAK